MLSGALTVNCEVIDRQGWGRLPKETNLTAEIGPAGATVWLKDAPLLHPDVIAMPG
ncbi:hypothetical protein NF552_25840 (plasmid) [Roseomonas mucosa]|nr:hypothetical protein NF552_25840 [Roseomonas mucosa]